jgi:hypothetical protein
VGFNGGGAEVQVLGDLGVGQAGGDQGEDFPLAACGPGEVPGDRLGGLRAVGELGLMAALTATLLTAALIRLCATDT